jgi:hypothetical protein
MRSSPASVPRPGPAGDPPRGHAEAADWNGGRGAGGRAARRPALLKWEKSSGWAYFFVSSTCPAPPQATRRPRPPFRARAHQSAPAPTIPRPRQSHRHRSPRGFDSAVRRAALREPQGSAPALAPARVRACCERPARRRLSSASRRARRSLLSVFRILRPMRPVSRACRGAA